jgi:hypothetical protein
MRKNKTDSETRNFQKREEKILIVEKLKKGNTVIRHNCRGAILFMKINRDFTTEENT